MTDADGAGVHANVDNVFRMSTRRPRFHFTPPRGWLNDPCAPYQDPKTGVYHLSYQWVPGSTEWTHQIGWGHATTSDLLHWQADGEPALMPEVEEEGYDVMGVFTGNIDMRSVGTERLVAVYSCINERAKLQRSEGYQQGQERLAVATSSDGTVWTKDARNPLPVGPPSNVTGWRDPYMFSSPALDSLLQNDSATYCLVSGGIDGLGSTIFLYTLPSSVPGQDLTDSLAEQWSYLGPVIGPLKREWPRSRWVGDIGLNWECAGMFTLPVSSPSPEPSQPVNPVDPVAAVAAAAAATAGQRERQWIILGSEGKYTHSLSDALPGEADEGKPPMWQLWYAGTLRNKKRDATATGAAGALASQEGDDGVELDIELEGVLDWGCLYATQTSMCNDGRRFMWGWLPDDDLTPDGRAAQGWAGAMSLPRELFTWEQPDVLRALITPLSDLPNCDAIPLPATSTSGAEGKERYTVRTLGMRVAKEIEAARDQEVDLCMGDGVGPSEAWEIELVGDVAECDVKEIGIRLSFAHGSAEIIFVPSSELLLVRRSQSIHHPSKSQQKQHIHTSPIFGSHTLFQTSSDGWEPLRLRVFWDGTILEVFANDRFALSTHLYGGECAPSVILRDRQGAEVGPSPPSAGTTGPGSVKARVWQYQ